MGVRLCNQLDMDLNPSSTLPSQLHVYGLAPHGCLISVTFPPLMQQFSNKPVELRVPIGVPQGSQCTSEKMIKVQSSRSTVSYSISVTLHEYFYILQWHLNLAD